MPDFFKELTSVCAKDFISMFLGKRLGNGVARKVYAHRLDPKLVIKIEEEGGNFQNPIEARVWEEVQYYKAMSKWLAPVVGVSPCGIILVQRRAEPIPKKDLPKFVPAFLRDIKQDNWGLIDGKPVCFDYGTTNLTFGKSIKMRKARWPEADAS